jgi:hypothetical protein
MVDPNQLPEHTVPEKIQNLAASGTLRGMISGCKSMGWSPNRSSWSWLL